MKTPMFANPLKTSVLAGVLTALASSGASGQVTTELPMLRGDTAATGNGWTATPIFTVGETIGTYKPVGILDGIYAFPQNSTSATVLVNHELGSSVGYAYTLKNGTQLTGARISSMRVTRKLNSSGVPVVTLSRAGLAYETVYDRQGVVVTAATQINEGTSATNGFDRFCASNGVVDGTFGFEDNIYFTGEESGKPFVPHGGSMWALDVRKRELWAAPALGRGAWENASVLRTDDPDTVALVLGDDTEGSSLCVYIGQKNALGDGSFLDRNGLAVGQLYAWKADNGDLTPQQFNTLDSFRSGTLVAIPVKDALSAGLPGYDAQGYLDNDKLQAAADAAGCFSFSRPEDVASNPVDGTQIAFASTGRGQLYPADNWGDVYVVDFDLDALTADFVIVHDADHIAVPDAGIRNPDNITWGDDGKIYVNEDRSTSPSSLFGAATGIEASVWQLDPATRVANRVAEIDRTVLAPAGVTDSAAGDKGNWETSGILDVTSLFGTLPGERLFLTDVQAHGLKDGPIGGNSQLVEGGQLLFLSKLGD